MSDKVLVKVSDEVSIESKNIEVGQYGLRFVNEVSRDEFARAFNTLNHINTLYQWYLGDLIVQADWQWKGEMYDMMMDITGLEYQSLKNLSAVARAYPVEIRQTVYENILKSGTGISTFKLGWSHFQSVAPLMNSHPEIAVDFLIRAGKEGWTVAELREEILRWKNGGKLPEPKEKAVVEIDDGFESVVDGRHSAYVPAPINLDEEEDAPVSNKLVEITRPEAKALITYLNGNSGFDSLIERLKTGFGL